MRGNFKTLAGLEIARAHEREMWREVIEAIGRSPIGIIVFAPLVVGMRAIWYSVWHFRKWQLTHRRRRPL